ncbi:hypothetical protein KY330_05875 [Candidatus Woesearchaeota archaeon]|nr:hypothetical protein [Candidatus Woesearchaeota archaeon]
MRYKNIILGLSLIGSLYLPGCSVRYSGNDYQRVAHYNNNLETRLEESFRNHENKEFTQEKLLASMLANQEKQIYLAKK